MFPQLNFDVPMKEQFWEEKMKRKINEMTSVSELKEIATLLAKIATQRAGVISGLTNALMKSEFGTTESCPHQSD